MWQSRSSRPTRRGCPPRPQAAAHPAWAPLDDCFHEGFGCLLKQRGGGVTHYSFFLINHLGEPFEAVELSFDNDQDACAHAQATAARRGYPVEVKSSGVRINLVPLMTWKAEDWLNRSPGFSRSPYPPLRTVHPRGPRTVACLKCRSAIARLNGQFCEACR